MSLKKWAEGDFKSDPQLNLIPTLYMKMKQEGQDFSEPQATVKREVQYSKDPNVVASQQEADDIAKAIELSLKEKTTSPKALSYSSANTTTSKSNPSSLYPSVSTLSNSTNSAAPSSTTPSKAPEPRKVRALYDFEAAEDNELTFKAGEIIMVFEESDPNWWRGSNHRGEGYFPANFVTADLSMEPEDLTTKESKSSKKNVQFNNNNENSNEVQKVEQTAVEINEETIDRLLFLLHEADPSDPSQDSDEMLRLENVVHQMGPLIDSELERVDRKHAQLTQLSSDLIDTINLYHSLMQSDNVTGMYGNFPGAPQQMFRPTGAMFSSNNPYTSMNNNMSMNMPMPGPQQQMHGYQPPLNNNFGAPPSGNYQMYQPPQQQLPSQAMPQQMPPQMMNPSMTMNQNNMHQQQQQQQPGVNGAIPHPSQQSSALQQMPPLSHEQQQAMFMHQQAMFSSSQQHGMQPITSPISSANTSMGQFNPSQMQNMQQHLQQIQTMPGGNN